MMQILLNKINSHDEDLSEEKDNYERMIQITNIQSRQYKYLELKKKKNINTIQMRMEDLKEKKKKIF